MQPCVPHSGRGVSCGAWSSPALGSARCHWLLFIWCQFPQLPTERIERKELPPEHQGLKTTFEGLVQRCSAVATDPVSCLCSCFSSRVDLIAKAEGQDWGLVPAQPLTSLPASPHPLVLLLLPGDFLFPPSHPPMLYSLSMPFSVPAERILLPLLSLCHTAPSQGLVCLPTGL